MRFALPSSPRRPGSLGVGRLRCTGSDAGMTTAEYAVGTVAACGFGGILYKLLTSDRVTSMLRDILERALTIAF